MLIPAAVSSAQDVMTLGSVADVSADELVPVPVFVRDTSGTPLGVDRPSGRAIQAFVVTVKATPADAVSTLDFERAGLTAALFPVYETEVGVGGDRRSWIVTFSEAQDPVPFTLDAPAPGDLIATLMVQIAPSFGPGDYVRLELRMTTTVLGNQLATVVERQGNGHLSLVDSLLGPPEIFSDGFESGDTSAW